ncbi:MAG: hypothetical protein A2X77_03925 [Gammaproteobacteria bacterium GWE2_42_36]|nr:MAG: hypothetical protein A2X77_03925 [Gammaproteobacteria bacterium GWE2_42_36]HCU04985.1 TIGR02449 family protein [Coxiellaceae bacterium]
MRHDVLGKLEQQVDALLQNHEKQKSENKLLREKQAKLLAERDRLLKKQTLAIQGIKKLIEKLKKVEKPS